MYIGVTSINLEDDGSVQIESFSFDKNNEVKENIMKIVEEANNNDRKKSSRGGRSNSSSSGSDDDNDKEKKVIELGPPPEMGMIYRSCKIISVHNFGVFVEVTVGHEGLVHVSELGITLLYLFILFCTLLF